MCEKRDGLFGFTCHRKTAPLILLMIKAVCFHVSLKSYLLILLLSPNLPACRFSSGISEVLPPQFHADL